MAWKGGDKSAGGKRSGVAAGFVGLGDYLANSKERGGPDHRIVAFGSNFDATDIHHAMREMDCVASQNARLKKPVFHWGFSLPKDKDTGQPLEQLSPQQWEALAYHSIRQLGLEHHQVTWVLHEDAGHQHIHLVANRQGWPCDGDTSTTNGRSYTYQHAYSDLQLKSSKFSGFGHFLYQDDIDKNTGLETSVYDVSGLRTGLAFDKLGRLKQVSPSHDRSSTSPTAHFVGRPPSKSPVTTPDSRPITGPTASDRAT